MRRPRSLPLRALVVALVALLSSACGNAPAPPPTPGPTRAASAAPDWWNGAVVYEVFVRSFRDSDGDGAGDLAGLLEKLDYLNDGDPATDSDLGVDAIWLMPIYPSPSTHGYDVTSYDAVNPTYGTLADLDRLVAACHARGIKVVLDWIPNHTSDAHPWFVDATSSPAAAHRDWYVWRSPNPGWTQPFGSGPAWFPGGGAWYYAAFWEHMPDLNWRNPAVAAEQSAAAIRWLGHGVDGFRLDAVRYLVENGPGPGQEDQPETRAALKAFADAVRAVRPDALLVGEAWADTATIAPYLGTPTAALPGGDALPLLFDFPLADAIVNGVSAGDARPIATALDAVARAYPAGTGDAPFLTNHDQVRVATRLSADPARLGLAAAILLTLQGTPFLYYGEELGLLNGDCADDACKRTPMSWDATATGGFTSGTPWWPLAPRGPTTSVAAQTGDPGSLLSRYRRLIRVRKASEALRRGGTERLAAASPGLLALVRALPGERVLVVHNLGIDTVRERLAVTAGAATPLLADPGAAIAPSPEGAEVTLPARATAIWRLE
ncbi:alpha-amylase family glycosyl hydrolase [Anaeromyxobacter oryzae]|uniref:Alpha-amylase n=1 Tax=Anaeromyxobacter oryzae TaxID=2918170 RepID=A0ABM7WUQ6_9BACT|nr:alpha-amylase family glycosyl hydrolase [Anaeromyxobacter oryzae]BDG03239.1 alpha-amylase [Anaeromyxobacter oryzae]